MITTKKTFREWRRGIGIPVVSLMVCAAMLAGCSEDDRMGPDGADPVAVSFTATVDGVAHPTDASRHTDTAGSSERTRAGYASAQELTGTTSAGVAYRDYTDVDGFDTRAFYPGAHASALKSGSANTPATRTTSGGEEWAQDDPVGIFMLSAGGSLSTPGHRLANNIQYKATPNNPASGASFAPANASEAICYPQSGNVDFVAYYPYGPTGVGAGQVTADYKYNITVAGQTSEAAQNALDVMYARADNGGTGYGRSKTAVALRFGHLLSKVTLNVTLGDGLTSLTGDDITAAEFSGMPQTAKLDLQDGSLAAGAAADFAALKASTASGGATATFIALVVPQPQDGGATSAGLPNVTSRTAVFTIGGQPYTWTIPDADAFAAGNHYTYPVTVKKNGLVVAGNPTITDWTTNDHGTVSAEVLTVRIPAGTFLMGSSDGSNTATGTPGVDINATPAEPNRLNSETQHVVTLSEDFYMSKYPVTNAQYAAFLNAKGVQCEYLHSEFISSNGGKCAWGDNNGQLMFLTHDWGITYENGTWKAQSGYENHPILNVAWHGAYEYAVWAGGALPTEAQWEYACRGGKANMPFGIGDGKKLTGDMANFDGDYPYDYDSGGYQSGGGGAYLQKTSPVGSYSANNYGLYDMHGNVWEWCSDWYDSNYYSDASAATDPTGPAGPTWWDSSRVLRGGCWNEYAQYCRSACRSSASPDHAYTAFGFRIVFVP